MTNLLWMKLPAHSAIKFERDAQMHQSHLNYAPMLVIRDPREIWKIFSLHCQRQGTLIPSSRADDELFHSVIENIYEERPLKRLGDMLKSLQKKEADALDGHGWTQSMIDFMYSVSCNIETGDSVFIDSVGAIIDLYYINSQHFFTLNKHRSGYLLSSSYAFEKIFKCSVDLFIDEARIVARGPVIHKLDEDDWEKLLVS